MVSMSFVLLFEFAAFLFVTIMCGCRTEEVIDIRFHGVDHTSLFLELGAFIIESLLVLKKTLLFSLERLQARQFLISLHRQKGTLGCFKNYQLCLMLCSECRLVFCLRVGIIAQSQT